MQQSERRKGAGRNTRLAPFAAAVLLRPVADMRLYLQDVREVPKREHRAIAFQAVEFDSFLSIFYSVVAALNLPLEARARALRDHL
jgi:hypothetical protein